MNMVLKSSLIGLIPALLYLALPLIDKKAKTNQSYSASYRVRIELPDTLNESTITSKYTVAAEILNLRLKKSGFESHYSLNREGPLAYNIELTVRKITDTALARNIISSTGNLEICETYGLQQLPNFYDAANKAGNIISPYPQHEEYVLKDSSLASLMKQNEEKEIRRKSVVTLIRFEGLEPPGCVGTVFLKDTGAAGRLLRSAEMIATLPSDAKYCFGVPFIHMEKEVANLHILRTGGVDSKVPISNQDIEYATVDLDEMTPKPMISLTFTEKGALAWENLTGKNIGKALAICVDNKVLSAPRVEERIVGGKAIISGSWTLTDCKSIAFQMANRKMPGQPIILYSRVYNTNTASYWKKTLIFLCLALFSTGVSYLIFKSLKWP